MVVGTLICPRRPSAKVVDPLMVLHQALRAEVEHPELLRPRLCSLPDRTPAVTELPRELHGGWTPLYHMGRSERIALIEKSNYLIIDGEDRFAGREVWELRTKPKRYYDPWKQLWVDKQTGAIMAARDWASNSKLRRVMKLSPPSPTVASREAKARGHSAEGSPFGTPNAARKALRAAGGGMSLPKYVPFGYELSDVWVSRAAKAVHVVYSNGLHAISVFQWTADGRNTQGVPAVVTHLGLQDVVAREKSRSRRVVVVADFPEDEAVRIADSIP